MSAAVDTKESCAHDKRKKCEVKSRAKNLRRRSYAICGHCSWRTCWNQRRSVPESNLREIRQVYDKKTSPTSSTCQRGPSRTTRPEPPSHTARYKRSRVPQASPSSGFSTAIRSRKNLKVPTGSRSSLGSPLSNRRKKRTQECSLSCCVSFEASNRPSNLIQWQTEDLSRWLAAIEHDPRAGVADRPLPRTAARPGHGASRHGHLNGAVADGRPAHPTATLQGDDTS